MVRHSFDYSKYATQKEESGKMAKSKQEIINELRDEVSELKLQYQNLKKFAREVIGEYCWNWCEEVDGGNIQDLAKQYNLIEPHIATEKDVNPEFDEYEVGDTIYRFADWMKE